MGSGPSITWRINGDSVTLIPGTPVACPAERLVRAHATSLTHASVVGIVATAGEPTIVTSIVRAGPAVLTADQWDAVTGETGGLTAGAVYYLDSTQGRLTRTPMSVLGYSSTEVGRAANSSVLLVDISKPLLL